MLDTNLNQVIFKTSYSRRFPDPNNELESSNIEHHILLMKAIDVPTGIPLDPNPRKQRIDLGIYKDIQRSLEDNGNPTFHLKNKGITMFAQKVEISPDKKVLTAYLGQGDGIADGGHTYKIILDSQSKNNCPEIQYVKIEIITGIAETDKADITGGLNTAVQVQEASLENLKNEFQWFKDTIQDMPYAKEIAYMQNEPGEFDIRDIVSFMTLFNVEHPAFLTGRTPKEAYTSKSACLNLYKDDKKSYMMLAPIVKDILDLHDHIHLNVGKRYNEEKGGKAGAMTGVFDTKKKTSFKYIFSRGESHYKLFDGTFFPIFGAMRYLVEKKPGEEFYSWKLKSYQEVKKFFDVLAPELLRVTYNTSVTYTRKPNAVGKDENHWGYLLQMVKSAYLERITQ